MRNARVLILPFGSRLERPVSKMENIHCPLCGAEDTTLIFKRKDLRHHISEEEFRVVRCRRCSLVYVNPRPTREEIHAYYPEEFYDPGLAADEVLQKLDWQLRKKYKYVQELAPGRLLDVGCDKGEFLFYMQKRGWEVKGLDFSSKPPNLFGLDIFYGDLGAAGYPPESFDLVTLWAVLEHIYDPLEMLAKIRWLLKPGGKLVVAVTNFNSLPARFMRHDDVPRHTILFTKRTLGAALQRAGFTPDDFHFDCDLYGGSHRGLMNYLVKLAAGEKMDEIVAQNRSATRWHEFSSRLQGRASSFMLKMDRFDIAFAPMQDRWMDRLHLGFIMVGTATKK